MFSNYTSYLCAVSSKVLTSVGLENMVGRDGRKLSLFLTSKASQYGTFACSGLFIFLLTLLFRLGSPKLMLKEGGGVLHIKYVFLFIQSGGFRAKVNIVSVSGEERKTLVPQPRPNL